MERIILFSGIAEVDLSSDNAVNLFDFISDGVTLDDVILKDIKLAMSKNEVKEFGGNHQSAIRTVGKDRVIIFDMLKDNNAEIEVPLYPLYKLTRKYLELERLENLWENIIITYENEVFEMSIKYKDGKEEHFKFEPEDKWAS